MLQKATYARGLHGLYAASVDLVSPQTQDSDLMLTARANSSLVHLLNTNHFLFLRCLDVIMKMTQKGRTCSSYMVS